MTQIKAATAMIKVVESENPPLRLALGTDAIGAIENKLESVNTELETWKSVAIDTTYEGASVGAIGS